MIALDIEVADPRWTAALDDPDALCERAARAALAAAPSVPAGPLAATLLFTDDAAIRAVNARWRGQDKPTNVLSFPAPPAPGAAIPGLPHELGDVVLAFETVAAEAAADGRTVADHATHLVVHGILHLLGLDHEDAAEAEDMERRETAALASLGVADPHREPA